MLSASVRIVGAKSAARSFGVMAQRLPDRMEDGMKEALVLMERWQKSRMRGSRTRAKRKGRSVTAPRGVLGVDTGRMRQSMSWDITRTGKAIRGEFGPQRVPYDFQVGDKSAFPLTTLRQNLVENEDRIVELTGKKPSLVLR